MSPSGQGLPSRLRRHHDRCTPDSCRLAATRKSAASGQEQSFASLGLVPALKSINGHCSFWILMKYKGSFDVTLDDAPLG